MKKRKLLCALKICLAVILCPFVLYGLIYMSMIISGFLQVNKNIKYQNSHLEYLKNEYYTEAYIPCNEQKIADFDLDKAFSDGVKINEIAVIGTHNSYQTLANAPKRIHEKVLQILYSGKKGTKADFEMDTLTHQLEYGVRNLEIDIETVDDGDSISFVISHSPVTDNASSAYDFLKGLEEIALWSDNNPGHLPVYLLIEPKGKVPPISNMKNFSAEYASELDQAIRQTLGEKLLTPETVMGDYESLKQMREADSWPTLSKAAGKIIVLLHPCDVTQEYIDRNTSLSSQAMFPVLRVEDADKSYAAFILDNDPENAVKNNRITVEEKNLMVRTRADSYPKFSDERYALADKCGSHIITTDYPIRSVRNHEHTYSFDGYTVRLLK